MDRLDVFRLLLRLADLQSFSAAAAELDISPSAASKAIAEIEAQLGAKLVNRTTRRLSLTEVGSVYLEKAAAILQAVEEADIEATGSSAAATGRLRINAPMTLGVTELGRALAAFSAAHPQIQLDVKLVDSHVDLLSEGFDLGLRATIEPKDSSYAAQRIAAFPFHVCASPDYLARRGTPATPPELVRHDCLDYVYASGGARWPLRWEGQTHIEVLPRMRANNTLFLKKLVLEGLGIAILPSFAAEPEIGNGALVDLFPHVECPPLVLYAVYPERRLAPKKVSVCVNYLSDWFRAQEARAGGQQGRAA